MLSARRRAGLRLGPDDRAYSGHRYAQIRHCRLHVRLHLWRPISVRRGTQLLANRLDEEPIGCHRPHASARPVRREQPDKGSHELASQCIIVRMGFRVAVAGASGYAGGELLRLLANHPDLEIVAASAYGNAGERLGDVHPGLRSLAHLTLGETSPDLFADADLAFLALPHGVSGGLAAQLPRAGEGGRPRRRSPPERPGGLSALLRHRSSRRLDVRAARTARPAGAHRGGRPGGQHRLLRRRDHPGAGAADRRRASRARRRRRGRRERHVRCRPIRQGQPAGQRGHRRFVAVPGRRTPARPGDPAGHRRGHAVAHADPGADAAGHPRDRDRSSRLDGA